MSVGRICCREVNIAAAEESVVEAARRLGAQRVGTLVILNAAKEPIGVVTDRDLVVRVLAAEKDPHRTQVGDIMTHQPKVITEDSPLEAALGLMHAGGVRRLPVVDHQRRLVGIVSLDDILALLAEEFAHIGGILERQQP